VTVDQDNKASGIMALIRMTRRPTRTGPHTHWPIFRLMPVTPTPGCGRSRTRARSTDFGAQQRPAVRGAADAFASDDHGAGRDVHVPLSGPPMDDRPRSPWSRPGPPARQRSTRRDRVECPASDISAGTAAEAASSKAAVRTNPNGTLTWTCEPGHPRLTGGSRSSSSCPRR
jgi:hypothetical protein